MSVITLHEPKLSQRHWRYAFMGALALFAIAASQTFFAFVRTVVPDGVTNDDGLKYDSVAIAKTLTGTLSTRHFTFHYSKDMKNLAELKARSERYDSVCDDVLRRLQLKKPKFSIRCFIYANGEEMNRCIGFSGGGFALMNEIHTLGFFSIEHESVHILFNSDVAYTKSQFFAEGIVQYFEHNRDGSAYQRDLDIVQRHLDQPVRDWIVGKKDFWDSPKDDWITVTYPISGAFVRFIIDQYGFLDFKAFYKMSANESKLTVEEAFEDTFRSRLNDDIAEFLALMRQTTNPIGLR
ncbi:MAG: hypothetical protein HY562_09795 [Ignavibacteriales bacterium]|nr:hypothetical protein [Ignavibacteriales bacterium]